MKAAIKKIQMPVSGGAERFEEFAQKGLLFNGCLVEVFSVQFKDYSGTSSFHVLLNGELYQHYNMKSACCVATAGDVLDALDDLESEHGVRATFDISEIIPASERGLYEILAKLRSAIRENNRKIEAERKK